MSSTLSRSPCPSQGRARAWCGCRRSACAGRTCTGSRGRDRRRACISGRFGARPRVRRHGGERPSAGRRVAVDPAVPCNACARCREGNNNLCPRVRFAGHGSTDGGLREYVAWQSDLLHPVPEGLTTRPWPCSNRSGWRCTPSTLAACASRARSPWWGAARSASCWCRWPGLLASRGCSPWSRLRTGGLPPSVAAPTWSLAPRRAKDTRRRGGRRVRSRRH